MNREPAQSAHPTKEWVRRLDRFAADLNVVLVMFAIGLATLDLTFLVTQRIVDRLPEMTRMVAVDSTPPNITGGRARLP